LEFGYPMAKSVTAFYRGIKMAQVDESLPIALREGLLLMAAHVRELDRLMAHCETTIEQAVKNDRVAQQLRTAHGVGTLTADAVSASVSNAKDFKNGRQFSAWLGLVPRQHSTGGKAKLGKITKRGDAYLRCLLVQGARSCVQSATRKEPMLRTREQRWIIALQDRIGFQKTLVAIANKHARQLWAMMVKGEDYNPEAWQQYACAA
jgi:transposase